MTTKEEQERRNFVHTVEVLLASALAERELAKASRGLFGQRMRRTSPRLGQPAAARRWTAVAAAIVAVLGGTFGAYEYSGWQPANRIEPQRIASAAKHRVDDEPIRQEAEAKRLAEAAAKKKADKEPVLQEGGASRLAEAAATQKMAEEERARQETEAKRLAEAAAKKKANEERARQDAEARRLAEAAAGKRSAEEAEKRGEEPRVAAATEVAARRQADADKTPERIASTVLNTEEREAFVKRVQEVLKQNNCYEGAINGSSDDAQKSLDRFIKSARLKGKDKPARIELAKASAGDFDSWLNDANDIKGGLCDVVKPRRAIPVARQLPIKREADQRVQHPPAPNSGGAGGVHPIEGLR